MLASRGGAVGKSTKEAYVCLSCRLKTQQRRYGGTKTRYSAAAATTINNDIVGPVGLDTALYDRQPRERVRRTSRKTRADTSTTGSRASPSRASTQRQHSHAREATSRKQRVTQHTRSGADTSSAWRNILAAEFRPIGTIEQRQERERHLNTVTRHFLKHVRMQQPEFLLGFRHVKTLQRTLAFNRQYRLAQDGMIASLIRAIEAERTSWSQSSSSEPLNQTLHVEYDHADIELPDGLDLNVLCHDLDSFCLGPTPLLPEDELPWAMENTQDLPTIMEPGCLKRDLLHRMKAQEEQEAIANVCRHFLIYLQQRFTIYGTHRVHQLVPDFRAYPQWRLDGLDEESPRVLDIVQRDLESMWREESQLSSSDHDPSRELGMSEIETLQGLEMSIVERDYDSFWRKSAAAMIGTFKEQTMRWRPKEGQILGLVVGTKGELLASSQNRKLRRAKAESVKPKGVERAPRLRIHGLKPGRAKHGENAQESGKIADSRGPVIRKHGLARDDALASLPQSEGVSFTNRSPLSTEETSPAAKQSVEDLFPGFEGVRLTNRSPLSMEETSPRTAKHTVQDPFPEFEGVRFYEPKYNASLPASNGEAKPESALMQNSDTTSTLESAIDQHLEDSSNSALDATSRDITPAGMVNPLSLWSSKDIGAVRQPSEHTNGEKANAVPIQYRADIDHDPFDDLDNNTRSAIAAVDQPTESVTWTHSLGKEQPSPGQLDDETRAALAALDEAAVAAAGPTGSNESLMQPAQHACRRPSTAFSSTFGSFAWQSSGTSAPPLSNDRPGGISARLYHSSVRAAQQSAAALDEDSQLQSSPVVRYTTGVDEYFKVPSADDKENPNGIRAQLRKWQELHGHEDPMPEVVEQDDYADMDTPTNNLTRLPDENAARRQMLAEEEEKQAFARFADAGKEGYDGSSDDDGRFLKMGDLVEIEYTGSERESILAVYVQSVLSGAKEAQFFTMQGRWIHMPTKSIMYSIPGWISPESVKPLLEHLPTPEETRDMSALLEKAYTEDLSVPREVAAPLVKRMVDFHNESQDIYRKNAAALDDAHNILAHDTDLRYGSLISAATTLLRTPSDRLPPTALYTVRKALTHGGFAFNIDRRSHRLTGYMQIRSKEQVRMVENVRDWVRQWQDDLAQTAGMDERQRERRRVLIGAQHIYSFLEKAKTIIMKNREARYPMPSSAWRNSGNIGISKTRLPITKDSDCVKIHYGQEFTADEAEIVRFMESWACTQMFVGLPRIESLPPLILQATGLYDDFLLAPGTGYVFVQELGTIMPYENRIRFDQHLLLPSSQHSKPLQNLMSSLMAMKDKHNFSDSMADLRHDWKDLPVYCIDDASAHEIDDGISVEPAAQDANGKEQHWIHVHIANPTAFFSRDHPLAKMARHMGETIYMPERTYMMLPRWATQRHFSLAPNRPVLTFSAKLDESGNTVDQKITAGIIRNVVSLTGQEVQQLVSGKDSHDDAPELELTVGGDPPPSRPRQSRVPDATQKNIDDLRLLEQLAAKRANLRKSNGGIFFDSHKPNVKVWQTWKTTGLAWDHPYRKGSRIVEGDPVIQIRTTGLRNWFAPNFNVVDILVRECMLLACETAASWCAQRKIPVIHRGTVADATVDSRKFWEENMVPAMREDGSFPMHLGIQYIRTLGSTVLRTEPKRHAFLGLDHYSKVTSPLRRYGDMILHWQIEAALRHEAQTGESLVVPYGSRNTTPDRSFLPFSKPVLDTIMLGLQPRESIISRAKARAEDFWICMLLFRKFHFNEDGGMPFKTLRVFLAAPPGQLQHGGSQSFCVELGVNMTLYDPKRYGILDEPRIGDVWECEIDVVDVYVRGTFARPIRLVGREGAGLV